MAEDGRNRREATEAERILTQRRKADARHATGGGSESNNNSSALRLFACLASALRALRKIPDLALFRVNSSAPEHRGRILR